ncbi:hypothetical protein RMCBS344292_06439 [Rhizopus microsporus]|nr:hypothetical protein RMCBS344292_06439 [Rhizopus microsporus]
MVRPRGNNTYRQSPLSRQQSFLQSPARSEAAVDASSPGENILDINNINHEAVRNDMDLRSISRRPSAFNSQPNETINTDEETNIDEGFEDLAYVEELQFLADHPEVEAAMRLVTDKREQMLSKNHTTAIRPSSPQADTDIKTCMELTRYCLNKWFEAIIFQFFMIYWVIKEPIIRTITFFTMLVSTFLVTPALFIWSVLFDRWTPSNKLRHRIASIITTALFVSLLYNIYPHLPTDMLPSIFGDPHAAEIAELLKKSETFKINDHGRQLNIINNKFIQYDDRFDLMNQLLVQHGIKLEEQGIKIDEHELELEQQKHNLRHVKTVTDDLTKKYEKLHPPADDKIDYALLSQGALVIPFMTSKTFRPLPTWVRAARRFVGLKKISGSGPEIALQPTVHHGECWSMQGASGTLAILLPQPIVIDGVTVEYPLPETVIEMSSAPKDIQILGAKDINQSNYAQTLGFIKYDIHKHQSVQTFEFESTKHLTVVLVQVLSNWGNREHTDLCRVRIHGRPSLE